MTLVRYKIEIETTLSETVGPSETVAICLYGTSGRKTGNLKLPTSRLGVPSFAPQRRSKFYLATQYMKGLTNITLQLSTQGTDPVVWGPGEMTVKCVETGEIWSFKGEQILTVVPQG